MKCIYRVKDINTAQVQFRQANNHNFKNERGKTTKIILLIFNPSHNMSLKAL